MPHISKEEKIEENLENNAVLSKKEEVEEESKTKPVNHDELQYLQACRDLIENAPLCENRTEKRTFQKFGLQFRFDLSNNTLPLITSKKMAFGSMLHELLWFIKGNTDNGVLLEKNCKIWTWNSTREFLDSRNLHHYAVNDCGPIYGFQWRHFGATYRGCKADYGNEGIDQLSGVIDRIKNNPNDRRHIVIAWNPADIDKMALPPCHLLFHFNVEDNKYLDCQLYQRSADMALGVPFNIASYSILTHIVAKLTNLQARHFVHTFGNYHIYENHREGIEEQIQREPYAFPKLRIRDRNQQSIDDFVFDDFIVENYQCHPRIKYDFVV